MPLAPDAEVVDALPYVDREYEARKAEVDLLIEQEMSQMEPRDYLEPLGPVHEPFSKSARLREEYERVAAGRSAVPLDMSRYAAPEPPANRKKNVGEWREAVANAEAQLEQQEVRLMNLELLNKYAANVWVRHNAAAEATKKRTEMALEAYREEITKVNQQRKEEQLTAGSSLHHLKMQWYELVAKNRLIQADCTRLELLLEEKKQRESRQEQSSGTKEISSDVEGAGDGDVEMKDAEEKGCALDASTTTAGAAQVSEEVAEVDMGEAEETPENEPLPVQEDEQQKEEATAAEGEDRAEKEAEVKAFVKGLLVKHLKEELKQRGLSTTGKKADLAARLQEHLLAELS